MDEVVTHSKSRALSSSILAVVSFVVVPASAAAIPPDAPSSASPAGSTAVVPTGRSPIENRPIGKGSPVKAAGLTVGKSSSASWWGQSLLALGVVLALIAGTTWAMKRYMPAAAGGNVGRSIEILGRHHLAPKQSLCLLRVGKRAVLIGITPTQMAPLLEIRDPQEVHLLLAKSNRQRFTEALTDQIETLSAPEPHGRPDAESNDKKRGAAGDQKARMAQAIDRFRAYARQKTATKG